MNIFLNIGTNKNKLMLIFENDRDPAMRYESLARAAFDDCGKYGDPWGYAAQDRYTVFVREPIELDGKRTLSTILIKLIIDNEGTEYVDKLKILEEKVWKITTQQQAIEIIDAACKLYGQSEE
jgi:hypothetical protein